MGIFVGFLFASCSVTRYELPQPTWYESQNYGELTHWIRYWERVLQEENRKCYYNYPHDHNYHRYVIKHLDLLYRYRSHMELRFNTCNYY
jgi:hypothetical protein